MNQIPNRLFTMSDCHEDDGMEHYIVRGQRLGVNRGEDACLAKLFGKYSRRAAGVSRPVGWLTTRQYRPAYAGLRRPLAGDTCQILRMLTWQEARNTQRSR